MEINFSTDHISPPIRLLIVDDHPVVRDGLRGMLSSQADLQVVGEAADGVEAVRLVEQLQPDVVLMDLRMPNLDGVGAITQIKAKLPYLHILVLTTYDSDADILRAIEAGATGYILKDAPRDELYRAVRSTAQGQAYLSLSVATRLVGQMRTPDRRGLSGGGALSDREIEVLTLVAKGESNKEIARHLHVGEATVKSHLLHIFSKLEVNDRTEAVTLALQKGIIKLQ